MQAGQRRIAGAEVVQRERHAEQLEFTQPRLDQLILRCKALGHFELQAGRRQATGLQGQAHLRGDARVAQLRARDIHRHHARRQVAQRSLPGCMLKAGLVEHEFTQCANEAAFFGDLDELHRRHRAALGVTPPHQGFHAADAAVRHIDNRLVDHEQLLGIQGSAQFGFEAATAPCALFQDRVEDAKAGPACALGLAHGQAGVLQQGVGVPLAVLQQHHADAGAAVHRLPAQVIGPAQGVAQPLCHQAGVVCAAQAFEQDHEFVPAQPRSRVFGSSRRFGGARALRPGAGLAGRVGGRNRRRESRRPCAVHAPSPADCIARAHGRVQAPGHQPQELVTRTLPACDVDAVEAVDIDEQHCKRLRRVVLRGAQRRVDALQHHGAVGQRCQAVDARGVVPVLGQALLLLPNRLRDVAQAGQQRVFVQPHQTHGQHRRRAARGGGAAQCDMQAFADHVTRLQRCRRQRTQMRRRGGQHGEEVVEVAIGRQRHQQLRRHRVDHRDLAVQRRLHQADRGPIQQLHEGLVSGRRTVCHGH